MTSAAVPLAAWRGGHDRIMQSNHRDSQRFLVVPQREHGAKIICKCNVDMIEWRPTCKRSAATIRTAETHEDRNREHHSEEYKPLVAVRRGPGKPLTFDVTTDSVSATWAAAARYAKTLASDAVVGLIGPLGAGKTQFARGIVAAAQGDADVFHGSPTFALVHEYRTSHGSLFHWDFYRLASAAELDRVGWQEYCTPDAVCLVEWADRFPVVMPARTRWLHCLIVGATERRFVELPSYSQTLEIV